MNVSIADEARLELENSRTSEKQQAGTSDVYRLIEHPRGYLIYKVRSFSARMSELPTSSDFFRPLTHSLTHSLTLVWNLDLRIRRGSLSRLVDLLSLILLLRHFHS